MPPSAVPARCFFILLSLGFRCSSILGSPSQLADVCTAVRHIAPLNPQSRAPDVGRGHAVPK
eukprot:scaffold23275_cov84-Isochrysis_galbana.AAC.1